MDTSADRVIAAVMLTGFAPEFVAERLGTTVSDLTEEAFLAEVDRLAEGGKALAWQLAPESGTLSAQIEDVAREQRRWRQREAKKQKRRAMIAWKAVVERVNTSGDSRLDQDFEQGFNPLLRAYLDDRSIPEFIEIAQRLAISNRGKIAAAKAHAENRAMKNDVFTWCDNHMAEYRSMDAAASAVAGKLVPMTWRTVRDWMTAWKKVRSAGTP